MFVFLPILFLLFSSFIIYQLKGRWRIAILYASVLTASFLTALTEFLSLGRMLSFYPLLLAWLLLVLGTGWRALKIIQKGELKPAFDIHRWSLPEKILLAIIIFIGVSTAITALIGVPNSWDSMTYHLPRVEHWIENRSADFYPTNIVRQLYITSWAEFAIAQIFILGGSESSANFIQWLAMAVALLGVSAIAEELGASRLGQLLAGAIAACLPMGILQAVSTQTDYAGSLWLVVFVSCLIQLKKKFSKGDTIIAGLSLGLALLTKGSSYVLVIPFLIWFLIGNIRRDFLQGLKAMGLILVLALSINLGQYVRNTQTFGSPMWTNTSLTNSAFDGKVLWVNLLRNVSIHLATPWADINDKMVQVLRGTAQELGADINDPRASFVDNFSIANFPLDEDYAGNFLHAFLFVAVFIGALFYRPFWKINTYSWTLLASFLLFCLITRFQPWNSRFHLPLFVLFSPVAGFILAQGLKGKSMMVALLLFAGSIPFVFANDQHPWFGEHSIWRNPRPAQYFYKRPGLPLAYATIAGYLQSQGCHQVGLTSGEDYWEYPWWVLLKSKDLRIEHVLVDNQTAKLNYPLGNFDPCAVIAYGPLPPSSLLVSGSMYAKGGSIPAGDSAMTLYLKNF